MIRLFLLSIVLLLSVYCLVTINYSYNYVPTHRLHGGESGCCAAEFTKQGRRPVRQDIVERLHQRAAPYGPASRHALQRGEEEEGHIGALLNHYYTATRTTAPLIHAAVTRIIHSTRVRHGTPTTTCPNTQRSVNVLTHIRATATHKAVGEQLK